MLSAARKSHFTPRVSRDHGKQQNSTKKIVARYTGEPGFHKMAKLWDILFIEPAYLGLFCELDLYVYRANIALLGY